MSDPKEHAARRKLFARGFSANSLRKNWEEIVFLKARLAVSSIRREDEMGNADILEWWTFMTADVIAHISFGESFQMLEKRERQHPCPAAMGSCVLRNCPFERIPTLFRPDDYILEYGSKAVANARARGHSDANLFSNMFAEADEKERSELTDSDVNWEAMGPIVAGSDTLKRLRIARLPYSKISTNSSQNFLLVKMPSLSTKKQHFPHSAPATDMYSNSSGADGA